jgi:hypothetical protein
LLIIQSTKFGKRSQGDREGAANRPGEKQVAGLGFGSSKGGR